MVTANVAAFFVEQSTGQAEADIDERLERIERILTEIRAERHADTPADHQQGQQPPI